MKDTIKFFGIIASITLIGFIMVACSNDDDGNNNGGDNKTLVSIAITTQPAKTTYAIGDTLDLRGLVVTAIYSDNTTQAVTTYTTSGFNSSTAGLKTIIVSYSGKTAEFTVLVNAGSGGGEKTVRYINISSKPAKQDYGIGDTLDLSGMVIRATYSDYTTQDVTTYTTSGFDSSTAGEKTVTVSYGGQTATFKVQVYASYTGTFNSISAFEAWLRVQPNNTANTAHTVTLNVSSLEGNYSKVGSVGYIIRANSSKYLNLDLSGSTITSLENSAFNSCSSITSVTIPTSVTRIGDNAFYGCNRLQNVTIPNSVTSIGTAAFRGCASFTSVTIPNSVTSIGASAFRECTYITSVTIPNSIIRIENYVFNKCRSLISVTIPNSVTSIGMEAFSYCDDLTSVTIPNSVTSIGDTAFRACHNLPSITIPNSVTSIGETAFANCSLFTSIIIPASVTSIGNCAFWICDNITSVTFQGMISSSGFHSRAFDGLGNLRDKYFATNGGIGTYKRTEGGSAWEKQ